MPSKPTSTATRTVPVGSLLQHRGTAVTLDEKVVMLQEGTVFEYEYLAYCSGSTGWPPWYSMTEDKRDGVESLRRLQGQIRDADDLIVVGGGDVGVELAADAKLMFPQKNVSLIHSREKLLNTFGPRLHDYTIGALQGLGVDIYVGERVSEEEFGKQGPSIITLKGGMTVPYDLLMKCTGQKPASSILSVLSPSSISTSGTIVVKKTLQIADPKYPHIYALGDVAETGGVRMGRAAAMQASFVTKNIVESIKGQKSAVLKEYKSIAILEAGIDLTLGLTKGVAYFRDKDREFLIPTTKKKIALDSEMAWKMNGAKPFEDTDYVDGKCA